MIISAEKTCETYYAALIFLSFSIDVGEGKLQSMSPESTFLPASVQFVEDVNHLVQCIFPDIRGSILMHCDCLIDEF